MSTPTTSEFVRSATSDAISSACFALLEELDSELRTTVLSESQELATSTLNSMIQEESKALESATS